jgi:hypothetical protein
MKPNAATVTFWGTNAEGLRADLYTVTLATSPSSPLYWTNYQTDLVVNTHTFVAGPSPSAPGITRGTVRRVLGIETQPLDLELQVSPSVLLGGRPMAQAAAEGVLYNALVKLEVIVMPTPGDLSLGSTWWFEGYVADVTASATSIRVTVKSLLERLNVQMPRRLIEPACPYTFCGAACGLSAATVTDTRTIQIGIGSSASYVKIDGSHPDGFYNLGVITFTSGTLLGIRRQITGHSGGALNLSPPLPRRPSAGDTASIMQGCAKTMDACVGYSNLNAFGGFPFVPVPESVR